MKTYKKIMNGVAMVEKLILVLATILIVVLTVGNVLSVSSFTSPGHLPKNLSLRYCTDHTDGCSFGRT